MTLSKSRNVAFHDLLETAAAWFLALLWVSPLAYAFWAAFHPSQYAVHFDLMAPLQRLYPELQTLTVKYIAFGAPQESYVRCGIGGNFAGSAYWIDNFRVGNAGDGGTGAAGG